MSRTLSMNCGSGESLNASVWCGLSANARQIRLTADWLIPVAAAIDRVDQCVASFGCSSSVFTITRSTSSSLIVRGFPGRGSSCNPSKPRRANRPRHLLTVLWLQPRSAAIPMLDRPSAAANTIRQRNANACALVGRRAHRSSVSRSSSLSTTSARTAITPPILVDDEDDFAAVLDDAADLIVDLARDLLGVVGFGAHLATEERHVVVAAENARAELLA